MAVLRVEKSNPLYSRKNTTTLTIHSSFIEQRQDISIYHHDTVNNHTPIVLLLHGVYGAHGVWMELGGAHIVYEQLKQSGLNDFVLVMPSDGGLWDGTAYLPLVKHGDFERWIVDDVINSVINNIEGVSNKSNLYISGLSMGGYGALRLGAKYPQKFSAISAHSSVTSLDDLQQFIDCPVSQYQCESEYESSLIYWFQKHKAHLPPLRFDCGKQDSLYPSNLALCQQLDTLNIDYHFDALDGGHEWQYWHTNLTKTLQFFNDIEKSLPIKSE